MPLKKPREYEELWAAGSSREAAAGAGCWGGGSWGFWGCHCHPLPCAKSGKWSLRKHLPHKTVAAQLLAEELEAESPTPRHSGGSWDSVPFLASGLFSAQPLEAAHLEITVLSGQNGLFTLLCA